MDDVAELAVEFVAQAPSLISEIKSAVGQADRIRAAQGAHRLKGMGVPGERGSWWTREAIWKRRRAQRLIRWRIGWPRWTRR
jgi:hypothetical protein